MGPFHVGGPSSCDFLTQKVYKDPVGHFLSTHTSHVTLESSCSFPIVSVVHPHVCTARGFAVFYIHLTGFMSFLRMSLLLLLVLTFGKLIVQLILFIYQVN